MHPSSSGAAPILLAHSYFLRYDPKQVQKMRPYPPLATLLVASAVRQRGWEVRLFDAMLADGVDAFHRMLDTVRPAIVGIVAISPRTLSVNHRHECQARSMGSSLRARTA